MNRIVALLLFAWAGSGCATIVHGTTQKIGVISDPPGANASTGDASCVTPGVLEVPRGRDGEITFKKQGYKTKKVDLYRTLSPVVWVNLLELWGFAIDFGTGGAWNVSPASVEVKLEPGEDPPPPKPVVSDAPAPSDTATSTPPPAGDAATVDNADRRVRGALRALTGGQSDTTAASSDTQVATSPPAPRHSGLAALLPVNTSRAKLSEGSKFALEEGIRTSLGDSLLPYGYTVLTGETTLAILNDNGVDPGKACEASCALQAARELKAELFVSASVVQDQGDLVAFIRVFEAKSGKQLGALQLEGASERALRRTFSDEAKNLVDEVMRNLNRVRPNG